MRDYNGDGLRIDGRLICYKLVTARDYLQAKGMSEQEAEDFQEEKNPVFRIINQIMALKQSCFMLRRTSYSCGSLSDDLYSLKMRLIHELRNDYNYEFDDDFVERNGEPQKYCKICNEPMIVCYGNSKRHGTYSSYNMRADANHSPEVRHADERINLH